MILHKFINPANAKVYVVEPQVVLRSAVVDALRKHGFVDIEAYGDLKTMLDRLLNVAADWVLSASCTTMDVNIIHLLSLCVEEPRLRTTKVSFLMREHEKDLLGFAFEWGLLSYHTTTIPSRVSDEVGDVMRVLRRVEFNGTLAASHYLSRLLTERRRWDDIIAVSKNMLEIFPGSPHILLNLAESELNAGKEEGKQTLKQVILLEPSLSEAAEQIGQNFSMGESLDLPLDLEILSDSRPINNALGLSSCVVIDPDTDVLHAIRQALTASGISNIETFESGQSAWDWLYSGQMPSLILMEWRIPDLNGPQLIQRIKQRFPAVTIVLVSSLISQSEIPLIKEVGAMWVVEKPFDTLSLLRKIVTAIQQNRYPTEQQTMDRRILNCLNYSNKEEAKRLVGIYLSSPHFLEVGKLRIKAEYAFSEGQFQESCTTAYEALRISSDSVDLLNLLGKSLMKMGDFENALRIFEKANILAPKNIERICGMVNASMNIGEVDKAEELLAEAKAIDAGNSLVIETEASLAIDLKDTERASSAMKQLDTLSRIVAYTNNKAVAKIRNEQFEEGMTLYKTALESLPEPWGVMHDTICFNHALAKIRILRYPEALLILSKIQTDPTSQLAQKATALRSKLNHAIRTKTHLQFSNEKNTSGHQEQGTDPIDFSKMIDTLLPDRGDLCCYRIFKANDLADKETRALLDNKPKISSSPVHYRDEAIPKKAN